MHDLGRGSTAPRRVWACWAASQETRFEGEKIALCTTNLLFSGFLGFFFKVDFSDTRVDQPGTEKVFSNSVMIK